MSSLRTELDTMRLKALGGAAGIRLPPPPCRGSLGLIWCEPMG